MVKRSFLVIVLSACLLSANAQVKPIPVIFDTDMATDYDDIGAITLLHFYADHGQAKILATIANTKYPRVAAVLSVMNTYFNRPQIPIGVPTGMASEIADAQKWSDTITAKYPHKIRSNSEAMDAAKLYRKVLASQKDKSVTIISVGFFVNLENLLRSGPDKYSPLNGRQLVSKKVLRLVAMAGKFPSGWEYNLGQFAAASVYVFNHWTTPVIFSGFEIGEKIHTGIPLIQNNHIMNDPVKDVFRISIPQAKEDANGRMSWDETAVFVAINGPAPYYTLIPGRIKINADGSNTWSATGNQNYLVVAHPPAEMEKIINDLIMYQPKNKLN